MKRTKPLRRDTEKAREFHARGRRSSAKSLTGGRASRARAISPASPAQKLKCAGAPCVVCAESPCDPAHVIPRSMGSGDHPLDVVPLCRRHHRAYDSESLDLLPFLEPRWRAEVAQAVRHVGLVAALQRITNARWSPDDQGGAA